MTQSPIDILGLTSAEFTARGDTLPHYRAVFRQGQPRPDLPGIVRELREGGTVKFVLRHGDGLETESVILPMVLRSGHVSHTLCVSSQVGCAMGCRFCETAQMGLLRNLSAAEIVAQWFVARHVCGVRIRNIVFMGMGEPMDNLDAVLQAVRILADRNGPAIAPASISISTVGRIAGIDHLSRFASAEGFRKLKLAVSINAGDDKTRAAIMPINRAEPMRLLREALERWTAAGGAPVLVEYVLIPAVNETRAQATSLAAYLSGLPCKVNVIPYNPRRDSPWPAPSEEQVIAFVDHLRAEGMFVKRRRTLGRAVMAACGQLGNPGIRARRFVQVGTDNVPNCD